jgi:hypothetical protein
MRNLSKSPTPPRIGWWLAGAIGLALAASRPAPSIAQSVAPAQSAATPAGDLKDREIELLKERLARAENEARRERISRVVFETQLRIVALGNFHVEKPVEYAPLDAQVLDRLLDEGLSEQYPGVALEQWVWLQALFGVLPADYDFESRLRDLLGEQVAGLYDPHSDKLYVSQSFPLERGIGRMVLAHEITHAMQDQDHDLDKMGIAAQGNGDRALAISCLAEGDATLAMGEYVVHSGQILSMLFDLPRMLTMDQQELSASPPGIQRMLIFPYMQGMGFFQALDGRTRRNPRGRAASGQGAWRRAIFEDPPISTSQILHPELYLRNLRPALIAPFEISDPARASSDVIGEFGMQLMFDAALGETKLSPWAALLGPPPVSERSARAAAGWNGDRILIEDNEARTRRSLRWVTRWDTADDAGEFFDALREGLKRRLGDAVRWTESSDSATGTGNDLNLAITQPDDRSVTLEGSFALPVSSD